MVWLVEFEHALFPLTPALSLRERECRRASGGEFGGRDILRAYTWWFPVPEGEGQGEGEGNIRMMEAVHVGLDAGL